LGRFSEEYYFFLDKILQNVENYYNDYKNDYKKFQMKGMEEQE